MELPQYTDYGKILEMNPFAAWQAGQQVDLARTFQQEKLAQEQAESQKRQLANIFSEQVNPLKVEEQRQGNLERQYGLPAKKLAGEIAERTGPQQIQAAIQDWAGKVSQGELDDIYRKGQHLALTGKTQQEKDAGLAIMQMTPEFVKLKQQHTQRMELEKFQQTEQTKRTGMTIAGQKERAAQVAAGKQLKASSIIDAVRTGKIPAERALVSFQTEEALADTPEDKAFYRDLSARMQTIINSREQAKAQGKPSIEGMGMEVQPAPQPYGQAASQQQEVPKYQVGQSYKGSTGTYKYKGGDPKDKNSWEKVTEKAK